MSKEHGDPYELDRSPLVDHSLCDERENTMRCENVCRLQLEGRGFLATTFCYYLSRRQYGMDYHFGECWSVGNMRCWNRNGRIDVMDRDVGKFWSIRRHYTGRKEHTEENWLTAPDFRYLHLTSLEQGKDLFLFGWGNVREIQEICDILNDFPELLTSIDTIPPNHEIIIGGHSEGSGWAYCFNEYLFKKGLPHERRVIGSGVLVANRQLLDRMDSYSRENSLFLTVGNLLPDHLLGGGMMPDVLPMKYKEQGTTFPMFGYKCDQRSDGCLGFEENPLDFNAGLQWVHRGCESADNRGIMSRLVKDVHSFSNYRDCYRVCIHEFRKVDGFNFQTNVPPFSVKKVGGIEDNPLIEAGISDATMGMERLSLGATSSTQLTSVSRMDTPNEPDDERKI